MGFSSSISYPPSSSIITVTFFGCAVQAPEEFITMCINCAYSVRLKVKLEFVKQLRLSKTLMKNIPATPSSMIFTCVNCNRKRAIVICETDSRLHVFSPVHYNVNEDGLWLL